MMRTSLIVISTVFSFCVHLQAQENFVAGYVLYKGDTLHGFVDYRAQKVPPQVIRFRPSSGTAVVAYDPSRIEGFFADGRLYVSAVVETDVSPRPRNKFDEVGDPQPLLMPDTAFLRVYYEGSKSLYHYVNAMGRDQFYVATDTVPYQFLVYRKYLGRVVERVGKLEDRKGYFRNRRYRYQLVSYLQDCPQLMKTLLTTDYVPGSLRKAFKRYYSCVPADPAYVRPTERIQFSVGFVGGITRSTIAIEGMEALANASVTPSTDFTGGVFLDMAMPANLHRWSLRNELT